MAYQAEIDKLEGRFREKPEQWFAALADAYRKSGDVDMALEVLNAWIDKRPSYTSGHIVLGRCHLDKQQDAVAAEAFEKVLELDMENVIALKSLSEIAERKGDSAGARGWLQRLLEVDPMNEEATTALERLGEGVEAAEAAEVAGAGDVEGGGEAFGLAGLADQPRDQPMPAMGFEATELQAPAEFEADSVTGFEPTGEVAEELDGVPIDGDAMLKADAIPEDVEAEVEEVPVDAAPTADLEPPVGEELVVPSIPDTVPEGFEAIKIEPDVDFASLVREEADEAEPPASTRIPDTLTDETALVMGPALEAMEGVGAEGAGEVDATEVAEEPEEAGFAFGFAPEAAGLPEEDASSDVAFEPRTDESEVDTSEATARPSEAVPIEFVEQVEEEPESEVPTVEAMPVEPEAAEPLQLIVPEGGTAAEPDADQRRAPEPEPIITETMAQLYASQGLYDDAAAVYRELLVQRPDDPHLLAKLEELEGPPAAGAASESTPTASLATPATGGQTVRAMLEQVIAGIRATETTGAEGAEGAGQLSEPFFAPADPSSESSEPIDLSDPLSPSDFSFDDFFGGGGEPGPSPEPEPPAASEKPEEPRGPESEDFKDWLKGLKT